jgi:hypothetical protein
LKNPLLPEEENVNVISIGLVIPFKLKLPIALNPVGVSSILVDVKPSSGYLEVFKN